MSLNLVTPWSRLGKRFQPRVRHSTIGRSRSGDEADLLAVLRAQRDMDLLAAGERRGAGILGVLAGLLQIVRGVLAHLLGTRSVLLEGDVVAEVEQRSRDVVGIECCDPGSLLLTELLPEEEAGGVLAGLVRRQLKVLTGCR